MVSGSFRIFQLGFSGKSRNRIDSFNLKLVTSTSIRSGISAGRHSIWTSLVRKSIMPPSSLTPCASPLRMTGTVTVMDRSIAS